MPASRSRHIGRTKRLRPLLQLLREFWMPLLLGAAWTGYNAFDKPGASWGLRETLNVFGPTFFFISWLVAQWHRVREQQRVEDDLRDLRDGVRALQAPLIPCRVFFALQSEAADEDLERVFGGQPGYRSYGPDKPMPPPPFGLPPGTTTARLVSAHGYMDFRDGHLEAAGITLPELPNYGVIHHQATHTVCRVSREEAAKIVSENEPLCMLPEVTVELYRNGRPRKRGVHPDLVLSSRMDDSRQPLRLFALDNTVFVDFATPQLSPSPADATSWSLTDLRGTFFRFTFQFFYVDDVASLPRQSWPTLRNLHLLLERGGQCVWFSPQLLATQVRDESPSPRIARGAVAPRIVFEYEMTSDNFQQGLHSVSSRD